MATVTTNLKLKVGDDLTADARSNLEKIDALGSIYTTNTLSDAILRSKTNIHILPQNPDIGGGGTGGTVNIGASDQSLSRLEVYGGTVDFNDSLLENVHLPANNSHKVTIQAGSLQTGDLTFTLPSNDGTSGQVLTTDGNGLMSWTTVAGGGGGGLEGTSSVWSLADGLVKTVTHGYGTRNVLVQVIDNDTSYETVDVCVSRPTDNTIELTRSENPTGNWTILLIKIA